MFAWTMACAALLYATGLLLKLTPSWASFATLTFCLSPLALPLETSFMTEIPALFFILAAVYSATQCALASSKRRQPCGFARH